MELSIIAESDEDVALELESERALGCEADRANSQAEMIDWADSVADSYLVVTAPKVDDKTLEQLAEDIDF